MRRSMIVLALYPLIAHSTTASVRFTGSAEQIATNDNRVPAGELRDGVLTVRLETRVGEWHPDRDTDRGVMQRAFGEEGKPLQIPGPLIRVAKGTEIHAFVRNTLDSALIVHGLFDRSTSTSDTFTVAAGQVREIRFRATTSGTYFYWAATRPDAATLPAVSDGSQLGGAFIVDGDSALGVPRDRVIVLSLWSSGALVQGGGARSAITRFAMNGKSWPNTERLTYTVGDSVRVRIVNVSQVPHPMHLHGFYYRIDSRGDNQVDTSYAGGSPRWAVTERVAPGRTMSFTWVPERAGNWLFHCHDNFHVLRNRGVDAPPLPDEHMIHVKNHALEMMGGLVMGVHVRPKGQALASSDRASRRLLRLIARVDSGGSEADPAFGYVLVDGKTNTPPRGPLVPGPTIVLQRGTPVSIAVVNELPEPTSVHWHGIELDSYFDGVSGFSGDSVTVSPVIPPGGSFEARFTPPRSGTFIYHPHADEVRQQHAGMSGAIVVVDSLRAYDPTHDLVMLVSTPRRAADAATVFLNGTNQPREHELRAGERYRFRVINIHTYRPSMVARLMRDTSAATWRATAKDGRDLPGDLATVRPAIQQLGNGETYDFEVVPEAGDYRFTVSAANGTLLVSMPLRVTAAARSRAAR